MYIFISHTAPTYNYYTPLAVVMLHRVGENWAVEKHPKKKMGRWRHRATLKNDGSVLTDRRRTHSSGSAGYQSLLPIQLLHLDKADNNL